MRACVRACVLPSLSVCVSVFVRPFHALCPLSFFIHPKNCTIPPTHSHTVFVFLLLQEDFEAPFLETTRAFYRAESQDFIAKNTCPDYMLKVTN